MKVIVLAAGEGKRMWPIQTDKCLIPFLGKPLLHHNLKLIQESFRQMSSDRGTNVLIVVKSQSKDKVSKIAQSLNLNFQIAEQSEPEGMADAILSAKDLIDGEILIVNAEDVLDPGVFKGVLGVKGDVAVAGFKVDKYFPGGYIKQGIGNRVKGIVEKPGEGNEPSDLVKLVVDYFKDGKQLVEYLEKVKSSTDDVYEVALDQMITDGMDVRFVKYEGIWIPLKYPWHILDIMDYLLSKVEKQISQGARVSKGATIEGKVMLEDGVRVFEGAVIKGPCYIGKNCIVGNNSFVRESILEEGCVTGFNSDITRSYIGANSWFHTNYVGDSVLEGDFGMGSGAVLANLRLDDHTIRVGDPSARFARRASSGWVDSSRHKLGLMTGRGVRIGVNASIMPGVRIGARSLVGPGVVLKKDLQENKKITVKEDSYEIKDYEPTPTSYDQFREKLK